jgi:hypothetical protein
MTLWTREDMGNLKEEGSTRSHSVVDMICQRLWSTRKTRLWNMNGHQHDQDVEGKIKKSSRKRGLKVCTVASWLKKIPTEGFRQHSDKSSGPTLMSIYDFWDDAV